MVTNILINGKWYLLLFRKMAEFLVNESQYDVYFASYDKPLEKVTSENFKEKDKIVKSFEDIRTSGDCFLLELELPDLNINFTTDKKKMVINSTHWESNSLLGKVATKNI